MNDKHHCGFSPLQIIIGIFTIILAVTICYLFYPTARCVYEWGSIADA